MTRQFTSAKHHNVSMAATEVALALQKIEHSAVAVALANIKSSLGELDGRRHEVEALIQRVSERKDSQKLWFARLRALMVGAAAVGRASENVEMAELAAIRSQGSEESVASLMAGVLNRAGTALDLALETRLKEVITCVQAINGRTAEAMQALAEADRAWATSYFAVIAFTNVGKATQQQAGVPVEKKKKAPRGLGKATLARRAAEKDAEQATGSRQAHAERV